MSPSPPPSRAGRDPGSATSVGHPNVMATLAPCPAATALPASPVSTRASSPFSTASYGRIDCASTDALSRLHRGSETPDLPVGHREAAGPIPPSDNPDHNHENDDDSDSASNDMSRASSRLAATARTPNSTPLSLSAPLSITDATDPVLAALAGDRAMLITKAARLEAEVARLNADLAAVRDAEEQYWQRDGRRVRQDLAAAEAMVDWVRHESDRAKAKLRHELAEAHAEIDRLVADRDAVADRIDSLEARLQDHAADCHAARAEAAHCVAERDAAVAECMRLTAECRVLRADRHRILIERDRWSHHQAQSQVLVADLEAARNEVTRLAAENKALAMTQYNLQVETGDIRADRDRARAELEAALQTLGVMRDRTSGMFRPASDGCVACEQGAEVAAQAAAVFEPIETTKPEYASESAAESDSSDASDDYVDASSSEADHFVDTSSDADPADASCRDCVRLTAERDALSLEKHKLKSLCGQVRSERDKAQHELASALQTLERVRERECAPLNRECVTLRQELQIVTHERDELRKKVMSCQTQVMRMKGQVSKLGRDATEAATRIAQLESDKVRGAQRWTEREVQWGAFLDHVDTYLTRHRRRAMALFRTVLLVARLGHERLKTKIADAELARARAENERDGAALQLKAALLLLRQANDPDDELLDDLQSCPELAAPATSLVTDDDCDEEPPHGLVSPRMPTYDHDRARPDSRTSANTNDPGAPSPALSITHSRRDSATDLIHAPIPTLSTPSRLAPPFPVRWRSSPAITTCSTPTSRASCVDGGFAHMRSRAAVDHGLFRTLHAASPGCRGTSGGAKKRHRGGRRRNVAARVLYVFAHGAVPAATHVPVDDALTADGSTSGGFARSYLVSETDMDASYLASDAGGLIAPSPSLFGEDLELVSMASPAPAAAAACAWIDPTPSVTSSSVSDVFLDDEDDVDLLSQSATMAPPLLDADGEAQYRRVVTRVTAERGRCFAGPDTGGGMWPWARAASRA
ncbi:hypothetical protein GGF31_003092 [Allomyces arbusculus]|nr:hypothetical protein GGF31_003092 [Allomyces arbusculus]